MDSPKAISFTLPINYLNTRKSFTFKKSLDGCREPQQLIITPSFNA